MLCTETPGALKHFVTLLLQSRPELEVKTSRSRSLVQIYHCLEEKPYALKDFFFNNRD